MASGLLAFAFSEVTIYMTVEACQSGNSPNPPQGCGYIWNLAFWQGYPQVTSLNYGIAAVGLGAFCIIIAIYLRHNEVRSDVAKHESTGAA